MRLLAIAFAAVALGGCATSQWESGYVGVREPGQSNEPLQVRVVAWDRIDAVLRELELDAARSDVPPDDWPPERKAEAHTKLIRGLQIQVDPRQVKVLGRSDFATTDPVRPNTQSGRGQLEDLAEKVGADTVIWSSHSLGLSETIVERPVFSYRQGEYVGGDPAMRATYSESETAWIPIRVKAERTAYIAFFLRYTPDQ